MPAATKTPKIEPAAAKTTPPTPAKPVRVKLNHHAYDAVVATDPGGERPVFAEVVTFGTRAEAIEYALTRKWDVVSGAPGVPLTELIAQAQP